MVDNASTIVGESILISGMLEGDEDLTVLGRVHGTINLTKTLSVEESGILKADVDVRNCIVSGVVVGNITASESVELTEQGRVVGDIRAPRVIIVDGARFRGTVDMGDLEAERPSAPLPSRTVPASGNRPSAMTTSVTGRAPTPAPRRVTPAPAPKAAAPKAAVEAKSPVKASKPTRAAPVAPARKKKIKKKVVVKKRRGR